MQVSAIVLLVNVLRFRHLITCVLALSACGDDTTDMPDRATCIDPKATTRYSALTIGPNVDGIALATRGSSSAASGVPATITMLPVLGAPCSKATDRAACEARASELLRAEDSAGWEVRTAMCGGGCSPVTNNDLAVITSGNDVKLATLDDLRAAVSPIETRDEAVALLMLGNGFVDCGSNNVRPEKDGFVFKYTSESCSGAISEIFTKISSADGKQSSAGTHKVKEADTGCIEGRRPAGLRVTDVPWLSGVGPCLAEIAHMEAAAVLAFDELHARLVERDAPAALLSRVVAAREDEVRHAAMTAGLAAKFGGDVPVPVVERVENERDLTLENAVEGCVREAFGAVVSAFQAARAGDAAIRSAFVEIARDEARHAELSWAIHAWLAVDCTAAMREAWDVLATELTEPAAEVRRVTGYPTLAEQRALLAALRSVVEDGAAAVAA